MQIIDAMVLVVDVTRGLQAQTAECLVVGEVAARRMVVALNKSDLLPAADRERGLKKARRRIAGTLDMTRFAGARMVATAAKPGGGGELAMGAGGEAEGLAELREALLEVVPCEPRPTGGPFLFSFDHCFAVKGQGTVLTGVCAAPRAPAAAAAAAAAFGAAHPAASAAAMALQSAAGQWGRER